MSGDGTLRMSTFIEQEAAKFLQMNELAIGEPTMVKKSGKREAGTISLTTNVYGITMDSSVKLYRYDVAIHGVLQCKDGREKKMELTKKVKNDAVFINRREVCRDVMMALKEQQDGKYFNAERCFYYDLQSIFFSLDRLDVGEMRDFDVLPSTKNKLRDFHKAIVYFRPIADGHASLTLGDLTAISRNLLLMDRSLEQFLDVATSQYAMFTPHEHVTFSAKSTYLLNPSDYRLNEQVSFDDTCSYLSYGVQKAVHMIEGPARTRSASIVVATKRTPFHAVVSLDQKMDALIRDPNRISDGDFRNLLNHLKGLSIETSHTGRTRRFEIRGLYRGGVASKTIIVNDKSMTIEQYFREKYNIILKRPDLPMVEFLGRDHQTNYVPMELCIVSDNQRVKTNQQTSKMTQMIIRKCAVSPAVSRDQNNNSAAALHLWDSKWLNQANIKIMPRPVDLEARSMTPPDMQFGEGNQRVNTNNFTWNGRRYYAPATCGVWAAYAFVDPRDRFALGELEKFVNAHVEECKVRGMNVPFPTDWDIRQSDYATIHDTFKTAADANCEFILVVHGDTGDAAHADVKYAERRFGIVTQCVRLSTLRTIMTKGQRQTMGNIVNKTNVKLNGLNYSFGMSPIVREVLGTDALYIGVGMNHPGGGLGFSGDDGASGIGMLSSEQMTSTSEGAPSVVGYAANVGPNNELDMCGDFFFQAPLREEKANIVSDIITRCIDYFVEGRKHTPKRLIMYRNGCSEGQFKMVLQYEVPLIKKALADRGCKANVTIIVVNRLQNIRFYKRQINPQDRAPDQNLKPGIVIDHTVVHPEFSEFYINAHRALQGTARVPKYTVLYNDNQYTLEQLEEISFHLCFNHQIVFMPTSVPTPLYIANRYAERGRMLYQRYIEHENQNLDYHTLTDKLCYYNTGLFGRRVNA